MEMLLTMRVALRALLKHKMRTALTILGIVIGVAAVTALVSVGQSAGTLVRGELEGLGTNVLIVLPAQAQEGGVRRGAVASLTAADAAAMEQECPSLLAVSPIVGARGQLLYRNTNWSPNELLGVGEDYLTIRNWGVRQGGFFTEREVRSAARVCVIGHTIVEKLFQTRNPIGERIRINNIPFQVIGVLERKGANLVGADQDSIVLAPYTTVRRSLRGSSFDNVDVVLASARSADRVDAAAREIDSLLLDRHRITYGGARDFEVRSMQEIAAMLGIVTGTMTALLAAIAGVSLLVGGVGIMNIMLVSVTERTREIGIRMAVGARPIDILTQFLCESVMLSLLGGLIGLALGTLGSIGITGLINALLPGTPWPIVVSGWAALLAIGFSGSVGIFFGFYPARRASLLDPIDALRYE